MKREWYQHFKHRNMFVFKESGKHKASGWDCKGNKFTNQFHFIDNRYIKVSHEAISNHLNKEFDN